jgi:5-oxopent-3-ene-1,2,5-tricarboxylate decarboxylase / 2-hydroxyhepta-2,4-diene-1,7-dioate isomerase
MSRALGHVFGTLLNHRAQWAAADVAARGEGSSYKALPKAPVLFVKPRNTFNGAATVAIPPGAGELMVAGSLALVFMPNFAQNPFSVLEFTASNAIDSVAWLQPMLDWSLPHGAASGGWHRPPLKFNARDGMLGLGSRAALALSWAELETVELALQVGAADPVRWRLGDATRKPLDLLKAMCEFMTPLPLDALMLGQMAMPDGSLPLARVGDAVRLWSPTHPEMGEITQTLVAAA